MSGWLERWIVNQSINPVQSAFYIVKDVGCFRAQIEVVYSTKLKQCAVLSVQRELQTADGGGNQKLM